MNAIDAQKLARQIFNLFDKQIVEAIQGTHIPDYFIAGLVGNEAGKDRAGLIVRGATRFEPEVYAHLIKVRDGHLSVWSKITLGDLRGASDEAIRALATSYEATQIMGYHCIHSLHCTIADLRDPNKHFFYTVKLLMLNGFPANASSNQMDNEMRQWNTGSEQGRTYSPDYVINAKAVRDAYAIMAKMRLPRTLGERLAGMDVVAPVGNSIAPPPPVANAFPCPECGAAIKEEDRGFLSDLCTDCVEKFKEELANQKQEAPAPGSVQTQPTSLKGWQAAFSGFALTILTTLLTKLGGLPDLVLIAIVLGGSIATSVLVVAVIWLKITREDRAE